jgi:alpha-methylacyl-CoA racemase
LSRLGLHAMTQDHPRLVHVEIVGHDGAKSEVAGHDLTYQAANGCLQPPHMPLVPVVDLLGAERAVSAALTGLLSRASTGRGGRIRVVLDEAAHAAGAPARHGLMGSGAVLGGAFPTYRIYPSADGYVALAALEAHFVARVRQHLGTTAQELTAIFAAESSAHWTELGARLDIPLVAISPAGGRRA